MLSGRKEQRGVAHAVLEVGVDVAQFQQVLYYYKVLVLFHSYVKRGVPVLILNIRVNPLLIQKNPTHALRV